jgi:hypothetical protein
MTDVAQIDSINIILNAIQTGGLIAFLTMSVMAFVWGWIYPKAIVEEYKKQIAELTTALNAANQGINRMADAWEARNQAEKDRVEWDRRGREGK